MTEYNVFFKCLDHTELMCGWIKASSPEEALKLAKTKLIIKE